MRHERPVTYRRRRATDDKSRGRGRSPPAQAESRAVANATYLLPGSADGGRAGATSRIGRCLCLEQGIRDPTILRTKDDL
jgi:hypothetical protein